MVSQKYKEMLGAKSVIRQMSEWAAGRAKEIGGENVFDFSLGNPSVPVPQTFTDKMMALCRTAIRWNFMGIASHRVFCLCVKSLQSF